MVLCALFLFSRVVCVTYCEVVSKQLHDECAVFVRVFIQRIKLCNGFIKSLQVQSQNLGNGN